MSFYSNTKPVLLEENFRVLEPIGKGSSSSVYVAVYNGPIARLQGRKVALKKIPRYGEQVAHLEASTALHQSLHHPSLVSLLASFSTPQHHYHVQELCSNGTLHDFMHARSPANPTLSEPELRGVMKILVESLIYLRRALVVHRDLKCSNILLDGDYRIKLSDFGLAIQLASTTSTTDTFCGSPNFVAPEVVSRLPYSFTADIWGMGVVALTCLSGEPPFEAENVSGIFNKVARADFTIPSHLSYEAKDLIRGLLELNPLDRIPLHRILSHPFFNPELSTTVLQPTTTPQVPCETSPEPSEQLPSFPRLPSGKSKAPRRSDIPWQPLGKNINNSDLRYLLDDELAYNRPMRRIVSEPVPRSRREISSSPQTGLREILVSRLASRATVDSLTLDAVEQDLPQEEILQSPVITQSPKHDNSFVDVPIGTTRPKPISTLLLSIQTHKMAHGSLTVLPSRSLLVDLREGERRRGRKGHEVFVIHGTEVSVYSAPHLSTPCCLTEPTAVYSLANLPATLWPQYNMAHSLVEQIKQKTAKLVMYREDTKCTLMANEPSSDIEVLFASPSQQPQHPSNSTTMRISLSRQRRTVLFARHVHPGEWTKKELGFVDDRHRLSMGVEGSAWKGLTDGEKEGMAKVLEFLTICEAVDKAESSPSKDTPAPRRSPSKKPKAKVATPTPMVAAPRSWGQTPSIAQAMSRLASRSPPSLGAAKSTQKPPLTGLSIGRVFSEPGSYRKPKERSAFREPTPQSSPPVDNTMQTRFIPSVGWCIRHQAGAKYSLMFVDGAVAEIDVQEEWVELKGTNGKSERHAIRDCGNVRELGERMRVFEDFVSMFDDGDEE